MPNHTNNIRKLRDNMGITQKELAAALNVTQTAITYWETGKREPSLEMIEKIAHFFNVSPAKIMGWEYYKSRVIQDYNACVEDEYKINLDIIDMHNGVSSVTDETLDSYVHELGEFLYSNPQHKVLFDSSMQVRKEDISFVKEMIDRINSSK